MKKEIIGYVGEYNDCWSFDTDKISYSSNIPTAIDELLEIDSQDGDRFKITIEKLNWGGLKWIITLEELMI